MLLCLPVLCFLVWWMRFGKNPPAAAVLLRRTAVLLTLIVAAAAWMGYYNYRVFGSPTPLPYTVDRAQYGVAPYSVWQSQRPEPLYRHEVIRRFYAQQELDGFQKIHSISGFVPQTLLKAAEGILFYAGIVLLVPLIMLRRVLLDRRIRFLVLCVLVSMVGQLVEIFLFPHYLAPFTAAFYAIGLQAMRHLRLWSPGNQPVGMMLVRLTVTLCVVLAGLRLSAEPLHLGLAGWPGPWASDWHGSDRRSGTTRARIESRLEQLPGKQLAIVRYSPDHQPMDEWVYNAADIENAKVLGALERPQAEMLHLM